MPTHHITRFRRSLLGVAASLALLATSCSGSADTATETSSAPVDASANDAAANTADSNEESLVVTTVTGGQIDFASLEGQDVVLWFWAPW